MIDEKKDLKNFNKDIASLKSQLTDINKDKEKWFGEKEKLKKEIADLIKKVKELKKEGDVSTSEAKNLKDERDKYNEKVKGLIKKISNLKKEKGDLLEKYEIKQDPEKIKKSIERMEEKIETEVLSIDKEKRLMDQIRRMKRLYDDLGGVKLISDKIGEISKEIEENKKKANEAHEKLKNVLRQKKRWYKEFFSVSKRINMIKKQQEKAFEMFISFKNSFVDVSRQLAGKLSIIRGEREKIGMKIKAKEKKKRERDEKLIEEKRKVVEEKLKKGGKLTTEDLLVMQDREDDRSKDVR